MSVEIGKITYFKEKVSHGHMATIVKIRAKLHDKVVMYLTNYYSHIRVHHPEVTMEIIFCVLTEPDEVFRKSNNAKEFYYHKNIDGTEYKVILAPSKYKRREVVTAYPVLDNEIEHDRYRFFCSYCCADRSIFTCENLWVSYYEITKEHEVLLTWSLKDFIHCPYHWTLLMIA